MTIPADKLKFYDAANEADLACATNGGCVRPDCNGFLCRNAIDAVVSVERERCAKLAREYPLTDIYEAHPNRAVAFNASQNIADMIEGKLVAARSSHHASDCALHNEPAFPAGPCDCGAIASAIRNEGEQG